MTLRIDRSAEGEWVVFTLSGRIRLDLIQDLLELVRSAPPDHGVVLDLKEVQLVDHDVVRFLAQIEKSGRC